MCSVQDKNKTDLFLRFQNQKQIYINTLHLNIISYLFIIFLRSNKKTQHNNSYLQFSDKQANYPT